MPNTEIILAAVSASSFLVLVVFLVLFLMKVSFMVKAIAWVKKLFGTSLNDQVSNICTTSDLSAYTENDDALWDILVDVTKDTEKCPAGSTPSPPSTSPAPTTSCTTSSTPAEKATCIQSNCSPWKAQFITGNPTVWKTDVLDTWITYPSGRCPAVSSYPFQSSENNWLASQIAQKCIPPPNLSGLQTANLYSIWASPTCDTTGLPIAQGPDGKTFYSPLTAITAMTGRSVNFGIRGASGQGTATFGAGGPGNVFNYTFNDSTTSGSNITFTGTLPSYMTGLTVRYNTSTSTLTVGTATWQLTEPVNTQKIVNRIFYSPTTGESIRIVSLSSLGYKATTTSTENTVPIFILFDLTTGRIQKQASDTTGFPYDGITFNLPGSTDPYVRQIQVNTVQWTDVNISDWRSFVGAGLLFYPPGVGTSQSIQFPPIASGAMSPYPVTFSTGPGTTPPTGVTYTATYNSSLARWNLTFSTAFLTYGTTGVIDRTTLQMGSTTFTNQSSAGSGDPRWDVPVTIQSYTTDTRFVPTSFFVSINTSGTVTISSHSNGTNPFYSATIIPSHLAIVNISISPIPTYFMVNSVSSVTTSTTQTGPMTSVTQYTRTFNCTYLSGPLTQTSFGSGIDVTAVRPNNSISLATNPTAQPLSTDNIYGRWVRFRSVQSGIYMVADTVGTMRILKQLRFGDKPNTWYWFRINPDGSLECRDISTDRFVINRSTALGSNSPAVTIGGTTPGSVTTKYKWSYDYSTKRITNGTECISGRRGQDANNTLALSVEAVIANDPYQMWVIDDDNQFIGHDGSSIDMNLASGTDADGTRVIGYSPNNQTDIDNARLLFDPRVGTIRFDRAQLRCVNAVYNPTTTVYDVNIKSCDYTDDRMRWFLDTTTKQLKNMYSGGCLQNNGNAQQLTVNRCIAGTPSQRWVNDPENS